MNVSRTAALVRARRAMGLARPRRRVARTIPPTTIEREYARRIVEITGLAERAFRSEIGTSLIYELQLNRNEMAGFHTDAPRDRVRDAVNRATTKLTEAVPLEEIRRVTREFASRTERWQGSQLQRQVRAALGVDLFNNDRWLSAAADTWVEENVSLITGNIDKIRGDLTTTVFRAVGEGQLWPALAKDLDDRYKFGEKRSRLIARDQVGKLYGRVTAARHQELGLTHFIWRCVDDDRVRGRPDGKYPNAEPSHWARNGKRYAYSAPPDDELPGTPINCRCVPEPDFSSLQEQSDYDEYAVIQ